MEVELSSHFLARAKKLSPEDKKKLSTRTEWFRANPNDPRLKTHALTGKLRGLCAFSVTYSKRIVFQYVKKNIALFVDIGNHDEVYNARH